MRLIDADALRQAVTTDYYEHYTQYHDSDQIALINMVEYDIEELETIDPETLPIVQELKEQLAKVTAERDAAVDSLENICMYGDPPSDVRPIVHGKWIECFEDWRKQIAGDKCSACGFEHYGTNISHYHFCPNCGADMRGGKP